VGPTAKDRRKSITSKWVDDIAIFGWHVSEETWQDNTKKITSRHIYIILYINTYIYIYPSYHHRPLHTCHYTHNTAYIILHTLRCLLVSTNAVPHTRRIGKDLIRGGFSGEMWRRLGSQRRATERLPLYNIAMEKAPFLDDLLIFTDLPINLAIEWITIW
jgi:hypothetical protein